MKIYISADIEGIGCIVRGEQSSPGGREYRWARRRMSAEVNAAIRGAYDGGADSVVVADSHNVGLNLIPEELDPRASLVMGSPRPLSMMEGVQPGFDAAFLVGYHSMAGTAASTIVHIFTRRISEVTVNGTSIGEIGISAALAGHYGIPVVLLSGDDKAVAEARDLLGELETVQVKQGISAYAALCLSPQQCEEKLYQGAKRAVGLADRLAPFRFGQPLHLEVRFATSSSVDRVAQIPGVTRVDGLTVRYTASDFPGAFRIFHLMADQMELVPFI